MVVPGQQPRHGATAIAPGAIGHQPFSRFRKGEVATNFAPPGEGRQGRGRGGKGHRQGSDRAATALPIVGQVEFGLFGSVLREDFGVGSDVDVLVSDGPGYRLSWGEWY